MLFWLRNIRKVIVGKKNIIFYPMYLVEKNEKVEDKNLFFVVKKWEYEKYNFFYKFTLIFLLNKINK